MKKNKKIHLADESDVKEYGRPPQQTATEDQPGNDADAQQVQPAGEALSEVEMLQKRIDELNDKYLRTQAEMQNIIRRSANEKADAVKYANAELLRSTLNVLDDLDRTIEAAGGDNTPDAKVQAVVKGVEIVRDTVMKLLSANGVEPVNAEQGQPFDPTRHEAMMRQPADSPVNTIVMELQKGYRYKDRVLRAAKVIVSAGNGEEP